MLFSIAILGLPALVYFANQGQSKLGTAQPNKKALNAFLIYIAWMLLMLLNSAFSLTSFIRIVQILGCLFAYICGSSIKWERKDFSFIQNIVKLILLVNFLIWISRGMPLQNFSFIIANPATYASVLYCWMMFLQLKEQKKFNDWLFMLIGLILIYASSARATLLAMLVFYAVVFYAKSAGKRKGKIFLQNIPNLFLHFINNFSNLYILRSNKI